jgi:transcriptional regulator with XRE-family HTH domain
MYRLNPEVLERACKALHLTSDGQLAEEIGVSKTTIRNWRHGRRLPSVARLMKLREITGIRLDELLIRDDVRDDAA